MFPVFKPSLNLTSILRRLVSNGIYVLISFGSQSVNYPPPPPDSCVTKRIVVSNIANVFDAFIKMKIFFKCIIGESKVDWDDPHCYSPTGANIVSMQLHGFTDNFEEASWSNLPAHCRFNQWCTYLTSFLENRGISIIYT